MCGTLAHGPRCARHPETSGANHAVHADPRWARLSRRVIERHVGEFGWVCPGDGPDHPAHPSRDLTGDHVVQLQEGGEAFPTGEGVRVLCRSRNSANGARLANERRAGRATPRIATPLDERAQVRARYLG